MKEPVVLKSRRPVRKLEKFYATGRRKEAAARVWISKGDGKVVVNYRDVSDYFGRAALRMLMTQPFDATNSENKFDVFCTVRGGGLSSQAGAIRHGISRALNILDPTSHTILRKEGLLTRDKRRVERKKYGHKKARKSFQFSKR